MQLGSGEVVQLDWNYKYAVNGDQRVRLEVANLKLVCNRVSWLAANHRQVIRLISTPVRSRSTDNKRRLGTLTRPASIRATLTMHSVSHARWSEFRRPPSNMPSGRISSQTKYSELRTQRAALSQDVSQKLSQAGFRLPDTTTPATVSRWRCWFFRWRARKDSNLRPPGS